MKPVRQIMILALVVILTCVVRDAVGAVVFWVHPGVSQAVMRMFDLLYFGYFAFTFLNTYRHRVFTRAQLALVTVILLLAFSQFARTDSVGALLRALRETLLPLAFLFSGAMSGFDDQSMGNERVLLMHCLSALLGTSLLVGIVQWSTARQLQDYWFYQYMVQSNMSIEESLTFIRNDVARGTGLGFSPFSLGYFGLGFALLNLVTWQVYPSRLRVLERVLPVGGLLLICILACFISDTRLAMSTLLLTICLWRSKLSPKLLGIGGLVLVILAGPSFVDRLQDASFSGRFVQWKEALAAGVLTQPFGSSAASGPTGPWFDSFILNFANTYGMLCLVLLIALVVSFAWRIKDATKSFLLVIAILLQALVQALEYNVFLQLAFLALGMSYGQSRRMTTARQAVLEGG